MIGLDRPGMPCDRPEHASRADRRTFRGLAARG
jgi:hypothetical protein